METLLLALTALSALASNGGGSELLISRYEEAMKDCEAQKAVLSEDETFDLLGEPVQIGERVNTNGDDGHLPFILQNSGDHYSLCYFDKASKGFFYVDNGEKVGDDDLLLEMAALTSNGIFSQPRIEVPSDAITADYYMYFERLGVRHAYNSNGTCTIVALEILLSYYDTFYNDNIIPENLDYTAESMTLTASLNHDNSWEDFSESPGSIDWSGHDDKDPNSPENVSTFHDLLADLCREQIGEEPNEGLHAKYQKKLGEVYLQSRNIEFSSSSAETGVVDLATNKQIEVIKTALDEGRPVIANGSGHSVVAYAYDDEHVWVHNGWGRTATVTWEAFESSLFKNWTAGAIDIYPTGNHVHSNNYHQKYMKQYLCPCGQITQELSADDFSLPSQYSPDVSTCTGGPIDYKISLSCQRAISCDEKLVISAVKQSKGESFVKFEFPYPVTNLFIKMSYWSQEDKSVADKSDYTCHLEFQNDAGLWVVLYDIDKATSMSTNPNGQYGFNFDLPSPSKSLRLICFKRYDYDGQERLCRFSIGNMEVAYES